LFGSLCKALIIVQTAAQIASIFLCKLLATLDIFLLNKSLQGIHQSIPWVQKTQSAQAGFESFIPDIDKY